MTPKRRDPPAESPTLRDLMAEYQAGSVDAFHRLHDALAPDLKTYLNKLTRDPLRADDLLQETFLQMHRARAAHSPGQPVRPWLFAIAKRVFLMDLRATARRARHERIAAERVDASTARSEIERLNARGRVELALKQTPADGRRAFILHHLIGFSFKEIAARLGIKPAAAKIRSSRAAGLMRAALRESGDE